MVSLRRKRSLDEVTGVLLFFGGILLLLALCSFEPRDVSPWLPYAKYAHSSEFPVNFIGRVGADIAGLFYFLFGAASYFAAMALVGVGIAKFTTPDFQLGIRLGWAFVFVLSWSTLLDLQHVILGDWKEKFNIQGPGGWFGHRIDLVLGRHVLGTLGSGLIFMALALVSLILATGFHPIMALRRGFGVLASLLMILGGRLFEMLKRRFASVKDEPLEPDAIKTSSYRTGNRRKPAPKNEEALEVAGESTVVASTPTELPSPKIIDASVPAPARKPTLAEVMKGKNNSKKQETPAGATPLGEVNFEEYVLPGFDLLESYDDEGHKPVDPAELQGVQKIILETLAQFDIEASPGDITKGPTITRYEVYPAIGVRVERISALEKNLARATRAERINILAPIPGKDTVGIEIANSNKVKVSIRELFESEAWHSTKAALPLALGKDVYGHAIIADLAAMPHLLVAGATGSGKSVCINSIITSLLFRHTPETLRFIMIDPKVVEMQVYNDLPHLVTPVVTDPKKVLLALRWVVDEMEKRYAMFAKVGVKNIGGFNSRPKAEKPTAEGAEESPESQEVADESLESGAETSAEDQVSIEAEEQDALPELPLKSDDEMIIPDQLPFIVVIVDELADLMQTAPADVEGAIARITQKARAAGIHMIVATQTPRSSVVTGVIKANIPSRIAFQVASGLDSRVILDMNGAEKLLGKGDMLYLPPGSAKLTRAQGVLVTDEEIHRIVANLGAQAKPVFEPSISAKLASTTMPEDEVTDEEEDLVDKCLEIIRQEKKASTSMLQRRLRLGYTRAARIVDILEQRGILGPKDGARDREILVDLDGLED
jgi:S-DNA-T family DNA segregation ATPase FtsK/SpoIIIE